MIILRQKNYSWFDKLRDLADKANKKIDPNWKTEKERSEERFKAIETKRVEEDKKRDEDFAAISPQHKTLLEIERRTSKFLPTWGDGDEYPSLYLIKEDYPGPGLKLGDITLGVQFNENFRWDGKTWIEIFPARNKKIYNLKQELIRRFQNHLHKWKNKDYLDKKDCDEVIKYLENLIKEIKMSKL